MSELVAVSALLADRTRARILEELLGGVPLPVGALAARAGVAPSTATGHVRKLADAGLVVVEPAGRRREVRLVGPEVAEALEALSRLADGRARPNGLRAANRQEALRRARSCYDHLAGQLGIALADALVEQGALDLRDGAFTVRDAGRLRAYGVEVDALRGGRRPLVRACTDWTERRPHVAGAIGAALLGSMLDRGWLRRRRDDRALLVTRAGERALGELGVTL